MLDILTIIQYTIIVLLTMFLVMHIRYRRQSVKIVEQLQRKSKELEEQTQVAAEAVEYASRIQKNLLPNKSVMEEAFADYHVIWGPRDVVGGDIYWAKNFEEGTVLCVCDCTGHGVPGALLTMLLMSAFESFITEKYHTNTAQAMYLIDNKLSAVLDSNRAHGTIDIKDGCDLAILFIANDGTITMSSGNINVFVCDGKEVTRYKGQSIQIGEGNLRGKDDVNTVIIPPNPDNKFYIASDGLFDQIGGENNKQFGYNRFKQIILENHDRMQLYIASEVWDAFEEHRGKQPRRDDVELITFKLKQGEN